MISHGTRKKKKYKKNASTGYNYITSTEYICSTTNINIPTTGSTRASFSEPEVPEAYKSATAENV